MSTETSNTYISRTGNGVTDYNLVPLFDKSKKEIHRLQNIKKIFDDAGIKLIDPETLLQDINSAIECCKSQVQITNNSSLRLDRKVSEYIIKNLTTLTENVGKPSSGSLDINRPSSMLHKTPYSAVDFKSYCQMELDNYQSQLTLTSESFPKNEHKTPNKIIKSLKKLIKSYENFSGNWLSLRQAGTAQLNLTQSTNNFTQICLFECEIIKTALEMSNTYTKGRHLNLALDILARDLGTIYLEHTGRIPTRKYYRTPVDEKFSPFEYLLKTCITIVNSGGNTKLIELTDKAIQHTKANISQ